MRPFFMTLAAGTAALASLKGTLQRSGSYLYFWATTK